MRAELKGHQGDRRQVESESLGRAHPSRSGAPAGGTRKVMDRKVLWLRALGSGQPPETIEYNHTELRIVRVLKHDFFAATAIYERTGSLGNSGVPAKVILKIGRTHDVFGLPAVSVGRWLARREAANYRLLQGVAGIPAFLGLWGRTGFLHEYVEGHPLQRRERVSDEFFPALKRLLREVHERGAAYVDLEKRENILVGDDGRPYLIDFQISFACTGRWTRGWLGRALLRRLQEGDRYHLMKHWRRHRPDQLTSAQINLSYRRPLCIGVHRILFRPWTLLRRQTLRRITGGQWRPRKEDGGVLSGPPNQRAAANTDDRTSGSGSI